MGFLKRRFGPIDRRGVNNTLIFVPHLYLTYAFINLMAGITYTLLGRDAAVTAFGWFFMSGLDEWLLAASIIVFFFRVKSYEIPDLPK